MKCLFTRALSEVEGGKSAVQYWFDNQYLNPLDCELPVDTRVLTSWNEMADIALLFLSLKVLLIYRLKLWRLQERLCQGQLETLIHLFVLRTTATSF